MTGDRLPFQPGRRSSAAGHFARGVALGGAGGPGTAVEARVGTGVGLGSGGGGRVGPVVGAAVARWAGCVGVSGASVGDGPSVGASVGAGTGVPVERMT